MILQNGKRLDGCSDTVPVGTLQPFAGLTPPKGYLLCQGQLVSKITYSKLYEICGDMFGDGTETEFRLPDLRGKTIAGYDENDTAMNVIGKLLGQKTHTHTSAAHTHTVAGHTHTSAAHTHSTGNHTLTTSEIPSHNHNGTSDWAGAHKHAWGGWANWLALGSEQNIMKAGNSADYTAEAGSHQHTFTTNYTGGSGAHNHGNTGSTTPGATGSTSLTSDSTTPGATGSNSNYQPTITMNWIIKAVMLIPEYFIVENTLSSNSTENALSAAQGKALNDKFIDYATKAEMITYLPLSGGEITGSIKFPYGKYFVENGHAIDLNNSDIINANSIYYADVSNSANEGMHFKRSNNNWDTISVYDGNFYLYTNSTPDVAGTKNTILGTHNTKDYVVEYGTSGNWVYRKWNTGVAEAWAVITKSLKPALPEGNMYYDSCGFDIPSGVFSAAPVANITIYRAGGYGAYYTIGSISNVYCSGWVFCDVASSASADHYLQIQLMGKWK